MQSRVDAGVRIFAYETLGSTNAEALSLARATERGPLWVTADRQTAGRGRRGNVWRSEPGNLYATLLLTDSVPAGRAAELCFVAALALHDAVSSLTLKGEALGERVRLKWPNDLLIDGRKIAGILVEAETIQGRAPAVAIGIGVNCAHHPDGTLHPATDLAACGIAVEPRALLMRLVDAMEARLAQWNGGASFAATRADWLARAAGLGGDIVVRLPDRELTGTFETLDPAGRLMLRLPGGPLEAITVGEVFAPSSFIPPLKGEGIGGLRPPSSETPMRSVGYGEAPGRGFSDETPTRRARPVDLPLPGGGMGNK